LLQKRDDYSDDDDLEDGYGKEARFFDLPFVGGGSGGDEPEAKQGYGGYGGDSGYGGGGGGDSYGGYGGGGGGDHHGGGGYDNGYKVCKLYSCVNQKINLGLGPFCSMAFLKTTIH
jgi:hypothetical protein